MCSSGIRRSDDVRTCSYVRYSSLRGQVSSVHQIRAATENLAGGHGTLRTAKNSRFGISLGSTLLSWSEATLPRPLDARKSVYYRLLRHLSFGDAQRRWRHRRREGAKLPNFSRGPYDRGVGCDLKLARREASRRAPLTICGAWRDLPNPCRQTQRPWLVGEPLAQSPGP
jgi:hypothetical protein